MAMKPPRVNSMFTLLRFFVTSRRTDELLELCPGRDFGIGIREFPAGMPSRSRHLSSRDVPGWPLFIKEY